MRFPLLVFAAMAACLSSAQPITEGLVIGGIGRGGRTPFPTDAVVHQIVTGGWKAPSAGDTVKAPDGSMKSWTAIKANAEGWFESEALGGGYVFATVESHTDRIAMLDAQAHSVVYVNGELRTGDPYAYGWLQLPIRLKKGTNELLFGCARGRLKASISEVKDGRGALPFGDTTLPDILLGSRETLIGAIVVTNATDQEMRGWRIRSLSERDSRSESVDIPSVPPLGLRKVAVKLSPPLTTTTDDVSFRIELLDAKGKQQSEGKLSLRVRKPTDVHRRTFVSEIDGSVQYFAVNPAQKPFSQNALVFTLHGASVEALGQAEAYASKDWATLVAPTNRRPYGFDWEDWGRLDALEVMEIAKREFPHDPARISLTGHSMGGHGTWSLGATYPGRFAALGPSAGWTSFWSYTGAFKPGESAIEKVLRSAMGPSDTAAFSRNLIQPGIYALHGDADDNVPVQQARDMRQLLESFGKQIGYHEQKGAGHWWDDDAPGAACVDWKPMFELFRDARIPSHPQALDFTTTNPAISATCHWLTIEQQSDPSMPSRVQFAAPMHGVLAGTTENVLSLTIDLRRPQLWGLTIQLDGTSFKLDVQSEPVTFEKTAGGWVIGKKAKPEAKNPNRGGPFKQAFQNRFVMVYGTQGTPEENAWAESKARYDAETFYYRGNGSVEVMSDKQFPGKTGRDSSVILYGNADTNRAWSKALDSSPILVRGGMVELERRKIAGADQACLFVAKRNGTDRGLVGVVSGTGIVGMRLTNRIPYFVSGCAFPDWVVFRPNVLMEGPAGVEAAGYFGNDWTMSKGVEAAK